MKVSSRPSTTRCFESHLEGMREIEPSAAIDFVRLGVEEPNQSFERFVWIDISNPSETEAAYLRDDLRMHPLAVEDCMRGRQRPKIDQYTGYSFIVFYTTRINPSRARMALNELHIFLGRNFLITVHSHDISEIEQVISGCMATPARWSQSAAVAHALIDAITDRYFPLVEHFSNRIETFEEQVFLETPEASMERVAQLRRELIHFRRILGPERDVLSLLVRRDLLFVNPELIPYFQDVHDHVLRATEEVDTLRDLLTGLIEIQSSTTARQLNQTMQTLTAWSIILMTMALVASIYGMNFVFMPELEWRWGYALSLAIMMGLGLVIGAFFRRKRWL